MMKRRKAETRSRRSNEDEETKTPSIEIEADLSKGNKEKLQTGSKDRPKLAV